MARKHLGLAVSFAAIVGILLMGATAISATLNVPSEYATISEAVAHAKSGDTIQVSAGTYSSGFPVTVTIDNLTIEGSGNPELEVPSDAAGIVFKGVEGGAVRGLVITGAAIGIVVKDSFGVTVEGNLIDGTSEGIRLYRAEGCTVRENVVVNADGFAIFLEACGTTSDPAENNLTGNVVTGGNDGLFLFKSFGNTVSGDSYSDGDGFGVVLNDSDGNYLAGLTVVEYAGWGVYLVLSDGNTVTGSTITENAAGGIEIAGSAENSITSNRIQDNGDGLADDYQMIITSGDKEILYADPIPGNYPTFAAIAIEKHKVEAKFDLIREWLGYPDGDLWGELVEINQKLAGALSNIDAHDATGATDLIDSAIAEKHIIWDSSDAGHLILRSEYDAHIAGKGYKLEDGADYNFTHEDVEVNGVPFSYTANRWQDGVLGVDDFVNNPGQFDFFTYGTLDRDGSDNTAGNSDDEVSLEKLAIVHVIIEAIKVEIDKIKSDLDTQLSRGLLSQSERDALEVKLDDLLGYALSIEGRLVDLEGVIDDIDTDLSTAKTNIGTPDWNAAKGNVQDARDKIDQEIVDILELIGQDLDAVPHKIDLIDEELPPDSTINGTLLVGKKEKGGIDITSTEVDDLIANVVSALNVDDGAKAWLKEYNGSTSFDNDDIDDVDYSSSPSMDNRICSNVFTTDHAAAGESVAILVESGKHLFANNLITNEDLDDGVYGEVGRLNVGFVMLTDENTFVYNAIEWIDTGMIRGGDWDREDIQHELVFSKTAVLETWSNPEHNMAERTIDRMFVVKGRTSKIGDTISVSARVKWNRIALNLFEKNGIGIYIVDAESNTIDENIFLDNQNGGIVFADETPGPVGIKIEKNDYFGGYAVVNYSPLPVDAGDDYTPPAGEPYHAPVSGNVNPPASPHPFAPENFNTNTKFATLGIERFYDEHDPVLPPNLNFLPSGIVLPEEKPHRTSDLPIGASGIGEANHGFEEGWSLISIPLDPLNCDPSLVFIDIPFGEPLVYAYDACATAYVYPTCIAPDAGYWLYLVNPVEITVQGTFNNADQEILLECSGWHLIGTRYNAYWCNSTVTHDGETREVCDNGTAWIAGPYAYDGDGYVSPNSLDPWVGYWVYTFVDDVTLTIPWEQPVKPDSLNAMALPEGLTPPPPPALPDQSLESGGLIVTNEPNPIRDVHTTTFHVRAAVPIERIRVEIFDQSGSLVYSDEALGSDLTWHTDDNNGDYLANGVYLYRVSALINGKWVLAEVRKLAIFR